MQVLFGGIMADKKLLNQSIDRMAAEPFYLQLSKSIETAIENGEFEPGDKLPSETEFCRHFELARSTVRETLRTLEDRNRIRVIPRRGAFVVDPDNSGWVLQVAAGFFEGEVNQDNRKVETKVLGLDRKPLEGSPAKALNIPKDSIGLVLRRLRKLDGEVALYSENYLLSELEDIIHQGSVMQSGGSLNQTLDDAGYHIFGARRSVEAVSAHKKVAKLLEIPVGSPVLLVKSVSWDQNGRPFDYYTTWVRTDVVKVTVEAIASLNR